MGWRNPKAGAGDYRDDMRDSWSLVDTEAVLRGGRPQSADAAHLESAIAVLRSRAHGTADDSAVAAMASLLAEATLVPTPANRVWAPRSAAARPATAWRRRLSVVGVAAILASAGLAGTAVAADGAAPGDPLYRIDRAFEAVGIGNGGTSERLAESSKLASEGKINEALLHTADALKSAGDAQSSDALISAADRITAQGNGKSAEVKRQVSQMLSWMTSVGVEGRDFGRTVNAYARNLGSSDAHATDPAGSAGQPGDSSAPNGRGGSGAQGGASNPANPGGQGNASDPGRSGGPGSGDTGKPGDPRKSGDPGKSTAPNTNVVTPSGGSEAHPGNKSGG
jgi:hypothetical protein